ncbi:copper chaperone PCu(A)C [Methylobacterium sp. WL12]|uniref:copper chaperone PCu(A)C n=1 Tax=Methylobacterium sp. WL12 TaxID=2603890 RepID=UPI0011CAF0AC|nr:copper chaperone PCu(A)C [Methylobacterium sp. WL12]TXM65717.1 copper chaperone PCu(A)C [Methylobacterium sp. WL12]
MSTLSRFLATGSLVALALLAVPAGAHEYKAGALAIAHPWTRATPNGAKVGGGYLSVTNTGTTPDTLLGASVTGADHVEIHSMTMDGTVMKMAPVAGGLVIAPGATVTLAPGGYHMMFVDLQAPLKKGERVKGTLQFEKAGTVPVEFAVEAIGAKAPEGGHGAGGHGAAGHDHGH